MKEFLNKTMQIYKDGNNKNVAEFIEYFSVLTRQVVELLGEKPFHLRGPLNASALESVMSAIFIHKEHISDALKEKFILLKTYEKFNEFT